MTQLRESRDKLGLARETRNHCHGDLLTLCACRLQDPTLMSAIAGWAVAVDCDPRGRHARWPQPRLAMSARCRTSHNCILQSQSGKHRLGGHCQSLQNCQRQRTRCCCSPNSRSHSYHQAVSRHWLLPTPSWEPMQLGSDEGPTVWGHLTWGSAWSTSDCSNFPQALDTAGTLCTPKLCPQYFPLLSLTAQICPNKHYFCPLLSRWGTNMREWLTSRSSVKTKPEHQGLCGQRRRKFTPTAVGAVD